MDTRARYGEKLDDNSLLIREQFNIRLIGASAKARPLKTLTMIVKLIELAHRCGIRNGEDNNHQVPICHGFRKFFTTQLINSKVNPEIREMLLCHKIGLASAYYRPTEEEMFSEYEKALDNLTIDPANRLQRKVEKLEVEKTEFEALAADIARIKKKVKIK